MNGRAGEGGSAGSGRSAAFRRRHARQPRGYRPIAEALALLAVTFPLAVWLDPTAWFLTPLALLTLTKRPGEQYGLTWKHAGSVRFHLAVIVAVFPPYVLGHYALAHWGFGATFQLRCPPGFLWSVVYQILAIALGEEFFFRGYFQTECDRALGTPYRFLGANWGLGLPLTAGVFAACHLVFGGPGRLIVFFPGLLYGWLRARTSSIAVPVAYHGASNLLMSIMVASLG